MYHHARLATLLFIALLAVLAITSRSANTQDAAIYGIVDIGSLSESGAVFPVAVDYGGYYVVGSAVNTSGQLHAFAGNPYFSLQDLGTLGGPTSEATDTNPGGGYVVGHAVTASGTSHAFLSTGGAMTDLGTLGGPNSFATGVNDNGVVVGAALMEGTNAFQAFIKREGPMTPLPLGAVVESVAFAINSDEHVVGYQRISEASPISAFLLRNGIVTPIAPFGPDGVSSALAINDADVVVGYASTNSLGLDMHAFRWENGVMQDLGTLGGTQSAALAVSVDGRTIVGWSLNAQGQYRAAIWRDGQISDLNDLIKPGTGWVLEQATDIGNKDVVLGVGQHDGKNRGFLAVPPIDLALSIDAHVDEVTTNFPNPHEAGTQVRLGVSVYGSQEFSATNVVIRDTISGPVEYVSWFGADCDQDGQTLTCTLPLFDYGRTVAINVRSTGAGAFTHSAHIVSSDQLDATPGNNAATETNTAINLASLALASNSVTGGTSVLSRVTLTSPAGVGGFYVALSSSRPDVATVPSPFTVEPHVNGGLYREFYVTTKPVSAPVTVDITAKFGLVTKVIPLTIMPAGTAFPYGGAARAVPGVIQAEDFDGGGQNVGYRDTTPNNDGDAYRDEDVDIQATADAGGGFNVGWMAATEWLAYTINVQSAGTYRLDLRVAANGPGGRVHVEFDGVDKTGPMQIPNTGGWQSWATISAPVTLSAGSQRMRVVVDAPSASSIVGNLNFIQLTATGASSTPWGGSAVTLPGTVQAENFDLGGADRAYRDTTPKNSGGAYRPSEDVDIQATTDTGTGFNVGWMVPSEWLAYSVNVSTAGTYQLDLRVAAAGAGGRIHVEFNGVDKTGPMTIPNTGGWQTWTTITAPVALAAGPQVMRVVVDAAGPSGVVGNLNFIRVTNTSVVNDIVIYANDVPSSSLHGNWVKGSDTTSAAGVSLQTADNGFVAANSPLASPTDYVDLTFTPVPGHSYRLWLRLKALNDSKLNDAVWVQFSGAYAGSTQVFPLNSTSALLVNLATNSAATSLNGWGWANGAYWLTQPTAYTFPSGGPQTLRIQVREDGVQLDQVVLSPSTYFSAAPGGSTNDGTIVPKP